jgi:hypothetical protein
LEVFTDWAETPVTLDDESPTATICASLGEFVLVVCAECVTTSREPIEVLPDVTLTPLVVEEKAITRA